MCSKATDNAGKGAPSEDMCSAFFFTVFWCVFAEVFSDKINTAACGTAVPLSRIVNGRGTTKAEFPWMVYVQIANKWSAHNFTEAMCGGSIISPSFVLTAAHCVNTFGKRPFWVRVYYNTTEMRKGPSVSVDKTIVHPGFTWDTLANDVALLKLAYPVQFDKYVEPVCLPTQILPLSNVQAVVAGWGRTSEQGNPSNNLLYINRQILPYDVCKEGFINAEQAKAINDSMILCTSAREKDSCQGDSGGPLTVWTNEGKALQVGLVSFGIGCARGDKPSLYTRVSNYIPWIEKELSSAEENTSEGVHVNTKVHNVVISD